jgi:hypothetical protein
MRWKLVLLVLLLPLFLLLPSERPPEPTAPRKEFVQKPWRIEPATVGVAVVCQHRATIEAIKEVLETEQVADSIKAMSAKAVKEGECWRLPEPIELPIEEYTKIGEVPFPVAGEDSRWSKSVVLFEAVRVRNFWTLLEVPLLAN